MTVWVCRYCSIPCWLGDGGTHWVPSMCPFSGTAEWEEAEDEVFGED